MPIIDKEIIYNIKYCKNKERFNNYIINENDNIIIKQIDAYKLLPTTPKIKLECICDHCGKEFVISCQNLMRSQGKTTAPANLKIKQYQDNLILCKKCRAIHTSKVKYKTEYPTQNNIVKKQISNTHKNKTKDEKELSLQKYKQTCFERYGVYNTFQVEQFKQKAKETIQHKYGKQYNSINQIPEIKQKQKEAIQEKYGQQYTNPMQVPEIRAKVRQTLFQNNNCPVSKAQKYIYNILYEQEENKNNIKLNYPLDKYSLDIALLNEKIDIEYDGSGHDLTIKLNGLTELQFRHNEQIRNSYILDKQWKIIRIIAKNEYWFYGKLFAKEQLLHVINFVKNCLINTIHIWAYIDLDNDKVIMTHYDNTISNILNNQLLININDYSEQKIQSYIKNNYLYMTIREIAQQLNITILQVRYQYRKLNLKSKRDKWTKAELQYLYNNYIKLSIYELAKILHKSQDNIRIKLRQLGLRKTKIINKWTKDQINYLINNYANTSNKILAQHLNRNIDSIKNKAKYLKLYKKKGI